MPGMSVATLRDPEFLNISTISPLVSKCDIKVLYLGGNRNGSFFSKEVAKKLANTLPGCPIVGYYIEDKKDFGDHGDQIIIDAEGVKFKTLTKPYGFVAPDSRIWFQEFEDTDEFGNKIIREYLMTEGYLWTGQYEECQRVIDQGNNQSMELDKKTLKGHWSTDTNKGVEFFIINDAVMLNLCILGEDVEPCFEGANITAPNISTNFSKDDGFMPTLFTMMKQLKETLKEGGFSMADENVKDILEEEKKSETQGNVEQENIGENQVIVEEFKNNESDEKEKKDETQKEEDSSKDDDKKEEETSKDENEEDKKKYELLESEYEELKGKYASIEEEINSLREYRNSIEDEKKDAMINSFCMLSDEDKKDVIENKSKYTLDEIESKLSVICVRKKVNFNLDSEETKENDIPMLYNLDSASVDAGLPEWLKAVEKNGNE